VEPENFPLYSSLAKSKAPTNPYQEWQVDSTGEPVFESTPDGSDVTEFENEAENRERIGNRVQIMRKAWSVGHLQETFSQSGGVAGVPSEAARSKTLCVLKMKKAIEALIGSDQDIATATGGQGDKIRALGKFIDATNTDFPAFARTPSASIGTTSGLTEATFNAVLQSRYLATGDRKKTILYAGTTLKQAVTNFVRAESASVGNTYRVQQMAESKTVTLSVNTYDSDWGMVDVIPDVFLGRTSAGAIDTTSKSRGYLIDPDMVTIGFIENPTTFPLPDYGGGPRGYVRTIFTLAVKNPSAMAKFA